MRIRLLGLLVRYAVIL